MLFGRVKTHHPAIGADNPFSREIGGKMRNCVNVKFSENLAVWSTAINTLAINLTFFMTGHQAEINVAGSIEAQNLATGVSDARVLFNIGEFANHKRFGR